MKFNLSIIIPFYNSKKIIFKSLKEINKIQKKYPNIEIIYIDNNSTDNGSQIIKKYTSSKNIKLFKTKKKDNHAPGLARNIGIIRCRSKNILFLDIDDTISIKNLKKHDLLKKKYNSNFIILKKYSYNKAPNINYDKYNLKKFFLNTNNMEVIGIIFNKSFLLKYNIFFKGGFFEDIFFMFKCYFFNKKKIINFLDIIYKKKYNKNSITNINKTKFHLDSKFKAWKDIDFFLKKNLSTDEYNKNFPYIQFRFRGEFVNEYLNILKQDLKLDLKKKLIKYIIDNYKKIINYNFKIVTKKDKLAKKILTLN